MPDTDDEHLNSPDDNDDLHETYRLGQSMPTQSQMQGSHLLQDVPLRFPQQQQVPQGVHAQALMMSQVTVPTVIATQDSNVPGNEFEGLAHYVEALSQSAPPVVEHPAAVATAHVPPKGQSRQCNGPNNVSANNSSAGGRARGTKNYMDEERFNFLSIMEKHLPTNAMEWTLVANEHAFLYSKFPCDVESISYCVVENRRVTLCAHQQ